MRRRINIQQWRNKNTGELTHSYEEWTVHPAASMSKRALLRAEDALGGVPAPRGYLWVKVTEVRVDPGNNWVEA